MADVDVKSLAELARIEVPAEELSELKKEIPKILSFVEAIQSAETSGVAAANDPQRNVMRADDGAHDSGAYTETLLTAAPKTEDGYVVVKQVLSKDK